MHRILGLLLGLALSTTVALAKHVPTPAAAISFRLGDDPRPWTMVYQDGNRGEIIAEFTIDREDIDHWSERVAQQIDFATLPLDQHFQNWLAAIRHGDPQIVVTQQRLDDGSILATCDSAAFDEVSARRFIKGIDGVYLLASHVRHRLKHPEIRARRATIVTEASLVANPPKRPPA